VNIYSKRKYIITAIFVAVGLIFIISLFRLQVLDSEYKKYATSNVLREVIQYPARGLIYDRNGKLLVYNKTAYDLLITPREVEEFDTTLFCNLLDISEEDLEAGIQKAKKYSRYKPSILIKQISPERFALLKEQLYKFKGFHTQSRTLREYSTAVAAHALGELIKTLAHEKKLAILISSHLLGELTKTCDTLKIMRSGSIIKSGKVSEILNSTTKKYMICGNNLDDSMILRKLHTSVISGCVSLELEAKDAPQFLRQLTDEGNEISYFGPEMNINELYGKA